MRSTRVRSRTCCAPTCCQRRTSPRATYALLRHPLPLPREEDPDALGDGRGRPARLRHQPRAAYHPDRRMSTGMPVESAGTRTYGSRAAVGKPPAARLAPAPRRRPYYNPRRRHSTLGYRSPVELRARVRENEKKKINTWRRPSPHSPEVSTRSRQPHLPPHPLLHPARRAPQRTGDLRRSLARQPPPHRLLTKLLLRPGHRIASAVATPTRRACEAVRASRANETLAAHGKRTRTKCWRFEANETVVAVVRPKFP